MRQLSGLPIASPTSPCCRSTSSMAKTCFSATSTWRIFAKTYPSTKGSSTRRSSLFRLSELNLRARALSSTTCSGASSKLRRGGAPKGCTSTSASWTTRLSSLLTLKDFFLWVEEQIHILITGSPLSFWACRTLWSSTTEGNLPASCATWSRFVPSPWSIFEKRIKRGLSSLKS